MVTAFVVTTPNSGGKTNPLKKVCVFYIKCFCYNYCLLISRILMSGRTQLKLDNATFKTTLLYRQLQVMAVQYRLNYSRLMIGITIPCVLAMETVCLYNTISLVSGRGGNDSLGYNLLYAWTGIMLVVNVVYMFGMLAEVFNTSTEVLRMLNANPKLRRNPWFRRWVRSCQVLKIFIGGSNYLDRLTPLTLEDFVINQTVSLLLLRN